MPAILALGVWGQKDHEFDFILHHKLSLGQPGLREAPASKKQNRQ